MRRLGFGVLVVGLVLATVGCLTAPGDVSQISLVSSTTMNGWRYDFYRNAAYPCSISGDQTFVIGTKVGSSPTAIAPLWLFLHGGGIGAFDATGTALPDATQMTEQGSGALQSWLTNAGLLTNVRNDPAGFRVMSVSYCDRDGYSGTGQVDPNNPNTNSDGSARTTNGLSATKAALQFAEASYPTSKYFLHGASAGSAGAYYVSWAMQLSGNPPAGVVGDASVENDEKADAAFAQGICTAKYDPTFRALVPPRVDPQIANQANEIDKLVADGQLTVPLLHIWNHGDVADCGSHPMVCPLPDGSSPTLGSTDCTHRPLQAAIAAERPTSRSTNLPVCVDDDNTPNCSVHQVTIQAGLTNTDPASPPDYLTAIMGWVHARLADT